MLGVTTDDARTLVDPLGAPRSVRLVRRFDASRARVFRCLTDPEELVRWFPEEVRGSLAKATRTVLVFPEMRTWWDIESLENDVLIQFRWPWLPDDSYETTVRIELQPLGYGSQLTLTDGPFDLRVPGVLDAYVEAQEGWGEALAWLRGWVDFSVELRPRRYSA
jgi:uncharacterized protein YndB with AHSA1/START domain